MRMREKLTNYSFTITWVEGKSHYVADALSRAPVFTAEEEEIPTDSAIACLQVTDTGSLSSITSNIDKDYLALTEAIHEGIELSTLPAGHPARGYKDIADLISISNYGKSDIAMLNGKRIIVPFLARQIIIKELHRSHSGLIKTFKTVSQLYFWPGMKNELRQTIDTCTVCGEDRPAQPRPTGNCFPPSKAT